MQIPPDSKYRLLKTFNYEVNLDFALDALQKEKIDCKTEAGPGFRLFVAPQDFEKADKLLKSLELDDKKVQDDGEKAIEDYVDWTSHQYNPGYFTGGRMPGWQISRHNAGFFGLLFMISGGFGFCWQMSLLSTKSFSLFDLIWAFASFTGGIVIIFNKYKK